MARKELKIEDLTAVVDTREQTPLNLFPMTEIRAGLQTGDYSLAGLERLIAVERKSPSDFLGCVGQDRERFDRELERIVAYRYRALVIECTYEELRSGSPAVYGRSRVTPQAAVACAVRWAARGVHVQFVDSRDGAQHFVKAFLWLAAKELWSEASALHTQLRIAT
jgi:DNA excision repair protein ERCC-4